MMSRIENERMPAPRAPLLLSLLAVLAVTAAAGPLRAAPAADWSAAFAPAAVAANLPSGVNSYIVVGAGPVSPDLHGAATAMEGALRKSGRAGLVMNAAGLGSVEALDDAAIVGRCAALPVAWIAVVRVFAGPSEAQPQVVVTLYDKKAQVRSAFSGSAGPPAANTAAPAEGLGVSPAAVAGVSDVVRATGGDGNAGREKYDREFLSMIDNGDSVLAFQGKYRRPVELPEFYRLIGRADLAESYEGKRNLKWLLGVGGLATLGIGFAMAADDPGAPALVVVTLGATAATVGVVLPNGVGDQLPAVRESVERYNQGLKKKLELATRPAPPAGPRWVMAPFASGRGGGLALGGSF
jgi:hypothetical protein